MILSGVFLDTVINGIMRNFVHLGIGMVLNVVGVSLFCESNGLGWWGPYDPVRRIPGHCD
jgi:hypothetical protein